MLIVKLKNSFRKLNNKEIIHNISYFNESSNSYFIDFFKENFFLNFYKNLKITSISKKQYQSISILLLDFIHSYKGFRHLKGYPVRGQRTWSNCWSVYKNNQILRNIRFDWANKYYSGISKREIKIGLFAEIINLLWKKQWYKNWWEAKIRRLSRQTKLADDIFKIDLKSISLNQIFIPSKKKDLTKKQKSLKEKSMFLTGFSTGFSKETYVELLRVKNIKLINKKERFKIKLQNNSKN